MLEHVPVVDEPQNAPDGQQQIGFRGKSAAQQQVGDDGTDKEHNGDDKAEQPQNFAFSVAAGFGLTVAAQGHIGVGNRAADGDGIDQPDDGCTPQQGNGQGHQHDEKYRLARCAACRLAGKHLRQQVVFGHGLQKI